MADPTPPPDQQTEEARRRAAEAASRLDEATGGGPVSESADALRNDPAGGQFDYSEYQQLRNRHESRGGLRPDDLDRLGRLHDQFLADTFGDEEPPAGSEIPGIPRSPRPSPPPAETAGPVSVDDARRVVGNRPYGAEQVVYSEGMEPPTPSADRPRGRPAEAPVSAPNSQSPPPPDPTPRPTTPADVAGAAGSPPTIHPLPTPTYDFGPDPNGGSGGSGRGGSGSGSGGGGSGSGSGGGSGSGSGGGGSGGGGPGNPPPPDPNAPPPPPNNGDTASILEQILAMLERQTKLEEDRDAAGFYNTGVGGTTDYARHRQDYESEFLRRQKIDQYEARGEQVFDMASPMGGSGKNLANFGRRLYGIYQKTRNALRPNLIPPNPKDYDHQGNYIGAAGRAANAAAGQTKNTTGTATTRAGATGTATRATAAAGATKGTAARAAITAGGGAAGGGGGAAAGGAAAAAGGGGAAAGGGTMAGLSAAAGPIGIGIMFAAAVVEFGKAVYEFALSQEKEVRRLADVGGMQAQGVAELDAGRQMREIREAENTGESSLSLTRSIDDFEEKLEPITILLTNIANTVSGRLLDFVGGMVEPLAEGAEFVQKIYDCLPWSKGKDEKPTTPWDTIDRVANKADENTEHWPGGRSHPGGYWD